MAAGHDSRPKARLAREMGLLGLTATGVCSMVGAGINVIPFMIVLAGFLVVHTWKDLSAPAAAWYFRSTYLWALVMAMGSMIYWREARALRRTGIDLRARVAVLPPE